MGIAGDGAGRLCFCMCQHSVRCSWAAQTPQGDQQQKAAAHLGFGGEQGGAVFVGFLFTFFLMLQLYNKSFPPKFSVDIAGGLLLPVAAAMARFAVLYAA